MNSIREQVLALLNQVPRPPDTTIPLGATEQECVEFFNVTGIGLPLELKEWLQDCNGPCVGPGGLFGIVSAGYLKIEHFYDLHPKWKQRGWFPVAGDGNGDYYVLDSHAGSIGKHPIYFLDQATDWDQPSYIVASNLWSFLLFLLQDELDREQKKTSDWPFNRSKVLAADPDLEQYKNRVPLPWEDD